MIHDVMGFVADRRGVRLDGDDVRARNVKLGRGEGGYGVERDDRDEKWFSSEKC